MTYEQILNKLTTLCSKGEHCLYDMRVKMQRWGIEPDLQQEVLEYLVSEGYVNEERYTRAFINDKAKYNRWGRRKIESALIMKHISREIYVPLFDEIEDDTYITTLLPLLKAKSSSVKGKSDYEIRAKLIRYAMQRGFSYEQAERCLDSINTHEDL